jgi:osmoprotectant transport system permease protein
MRLLSFWVSHRAELLGMLGQHVLLVVVSTGVAVAIGVPLGVLAARRPRIGAPLIALANIVQTVPSLAMFGFLMPLPFIGGVGARTALVVLILYGLLPVIRTTTTGLTSIDRAIIESGIAMGMTPRQLLFQVELPLALPAIVAGVRVAAVVGVGAATIAAAIGAGGLGEYIFRGLSMVDPTVILAGAIPAALLALIADGSLTWLERRLSSRHRAQHSNVRTLKAVATVLILLVIGGTLASGRGRGRVVVGSKNFTEQVILGELIAQSIERYGGLRVDRRLNLGGTFICDRALRSGDVDVYVEYTGTALTAIFRNPVGRDSGQVLLDVRERYARLGISALAPLGFNNTFALFVRGADARTLQLKTISDVVPRAGAWRAGFGFEFLERADGYRGLVDAYGIRFNGEPRAMDLTLIYRALAERQVDVIAGDATSGLIEGLDLARLEDDRRYFPPYDAVPLVRTSTILASPAVGAAIDRLGGRITERDMRAMNNAVDVGHRDVRDVVHEFLNAISPQSTSASP